MNERRLDMATARFGSVLLLIIALAAAGCGSGPAPTVAVQSPVDTVNAYFGAMNSGDMSLAAAHWGSDRRETWMQEAPPHEEFQNLSCRPGSQVNSDIVDSSTKAVVACDFDIREDWSGFEAGVHYAWWGVWVERQPSGPWLIHDMGQPIGPW